MIGLILRLDYRSADLFRETQDRCLMTNLYVFRALDSKEKRKRFYGYG
jgi:hypothetical protein